MSAMTALIVTCISACSSPDNMATGRDESPVTNDTLTALAGPVTVSGVSSGAYMAVQMHVALSDRVAGAGVVAGGPYHCAAGNIANALGRCMSGSNLDITPLVSFTREASASGKIAETENLREAAVWIFHSERDQIVARSVATALADFYAEFVPADRIEFVGNEEAAHGWPTLQAGNDCLEIGGDFLNACNFDTAGKLLNHLYGKLEPRAGETVDEQLIRIDLSGFLVPDSGIAAQGYLFLPEDCRVSSAGCRLHLSFHGCRQGAEFVGNRFAANAGLNEWAARNRIVVVYPQIVASLVNPQGCWDWWGYTGPDYDQASGSQIAVIDSIITTFAAGHLYQSNEE